MWHRADECPFEVIHKARQFALSHEGVKVHVYGLKKIEPAIKTLLNTLGDSLGEYGWCNDLPSVYRAADIVITGSSIATRAIRESLACGCKVVSDFDREPNWILPVSSTDSAEKLVQICESEIAVGS